MCAGSPAGRRRAPQTYVDDYIYPTTSVTDENGLTDVRTYILEVDSTLRGLSADDRAKAERLTGWTPTVELTTHIRCRPAPGPLRVSITTRNLAGGFLEEDAEVTELGVVAAATVPVSVSVYACGSRTAAAPLPRPVFEKAVRRC